MITLNLELRTFMSAFIQRICLMYRAPIRAYKWQREWETGVGGAGGKLDTIP